MHTTAPAGAEHLVRSEPGELVKVRVAEDTGAARVDYEQAQRRCFTERSQPRLTLAQCAHAFAPVGDIEDRAGDAVDVAAGVERRIGEDLDPAGQTVVTQQARRMTRRIDLAAQQ